MPYYDICLLVKDYLDDLDYQSQPSSALRYGRMTRIPKFTVYRRVVSSFQGRRSDELLLGGGTVLLHGLHGQDPTHDGVVVRRRRDGPAARARPQHGAAQGEGGHDDADRCRHWRPETGKWQGLQTVSTLFDDQPVKYEFPAGDPVDP